MKLKLSRFFYPITLLWIYFWSKFYQKVCQPLRKYKKVTLESNHTPLTAWDSLRDLQYCADTWKVLWDVVVRPEYVQYALGCKRLEGKQPEGPMDCDDFAIWACNTIDEKFQPKLLSISYCKPTGKISGHAVCLCQDPDTKQFFHVGNWGLWGPYDSKEETIKSILTSSHSKLIAWTVKNPDLKLVEYKKDFK